jgi:hypothetical protein
MSSMVKDDLSEMDNDDIMFDKVKIEGTCQDLEKPYYRLTECHILPRLGHRVS